jgi:ankyrin repeat protein
VNAQTEGGSTALHCACSQGAATCVELLISAGAKIHLTNILNQTPSDVCRDSLSGDYQACQQLIETERQRIGMVFMKTSTGILAVTGLCYGLYYFLTTTNDQADNKKDNK